MAGPARGSSLGSASNSSGPGSRSANSPAVAAPFSGPIVEEPPAVCEAWPFGALPDPPRPPTIFTATNRPMAATARTMRAISAVRLKRRRFAGRAIPLMLSSHARLVRFPIIPCPARTPFDFPVFLSHNRRKGPRQGKGFGSGTTKLWRRGRLGSCRRRRRTMGAMPKVVGTVALVLILFGVSGGGSGVAAQTGQTGQIREEVTVALKLLQAYVTTKDGKPVTDLTAADFDVTDNGQKVSVTHFENHIIGGDEIAPEGPIAGPRLNRKFFFFFDFAFTDPRSARKAREAALHFMDNAVRPGDEIGVLSYSPTRGLTIHEYLSTDHDRIRGIVDAFGLRTVAGRAETLTSFLYADELRWMEVGGSLDAKASREAAFEKFFTEQAQAQTRGVVDEGR